MKRGIVILLAVSVGVIALFPPQGFAQSNPFRRLLGQESQTAERSLWFERADGRGGFTFDRTERQAYLQPDSMAEVYAVERVRASGGGEVWLTDTGRVLLRRSNLGGWTYFPADRPDGVIVEPIGQAQSLALSVADESDLQGAATDMVNTLARLTRNDIRAELTAVDPQTNAYIIDAMRMVQIGAEQTPRRAMRGWEVVRIGIGETARVDFSGDVLDISIAPGKGYAGRPSSASIQQALEFHAHG